MLGSSEAGSVQESRVGSNGGAEMRRGASSSGRSVKTKATIAATACLDNAPHRRERRGQATHDEIAKRRPIRREKMAGRPDDAGSSRPSGRSQQVQDLVGESAVAEHHLQVAGDGDLLQDFQLAEPHE
ncbi:hypothetical protein HK102_009020, partial [Quaeritorhiza haematococci]